MSSGELFFNPFYSLLRKEVMRFLKVSIQTILTPLVSSLLYLLIFGVSLGSYIQMKNGLTYIEFLIPGLVMMGCLNNAFQNASSSIIIAKFGGDLEDLKVAPISYTQIILAVAIGGLVRGLVVGITTYFVGAAFCYFKANIVLGIQHPLWLLVFVSIGGLAFSLLGLAAAFWAKSFDQMAVVNSFILLPLMYLGGVFFSIERLGPFWQSVARSNPLVYFINGVRFGFLGVADVEPTTALLVALATLIGLYLLCLRTLKRASFLRW